MVKWTEAQQEAIDYNDSNLLVSAAAGSGKTAVLVERIIKKVTSEAAPLDIDEILVSTFTNKAAEEMRNRIGIALKEAIETNPTSQHLKKQLSLLQKSHISTLHAFCMTVVRQYAYLVDIDPAFRIADEMEIELMRQETMDELLEEAYQTNDDTIDQVINLANMYSNDRDDVGLGEVILKLSLTANETPWPETWLNNIVTQYEVTDLSKEKNLTWLNSLKNDVEEDIQMMLSENKLALQIANDINGPAQYIEALESDRQLIEVACRHLDTWDDFIQYANAIHFIGLSRKKSECDPILKENTKKLRDQYKKIWESKIKPLCTRNLESQLKDLEKLLPSIRKLVELTLRYQEVFKQKKKEKTVLDFSDLEHLTLNILLDDKSTPEHIVYSNVSKQYKSQFKEVYVDEYQDINLVQETIIQAVSDQSDKGNLFMVGDVKQSIYRFRSAEPQLFIEKYSSYRQGDAHGKKIDLARNFRSRKYILDGANYIFRQLFDVPLGEIEYNEDVELSYGNLGYEDLPFETKAMDLALIKQEAVNEHVESENQNLESLLKTQLEARYYAKKIKEWIGVDNHQPMQVFDKTLGKQRDMTYRDIVILKRSTTSFSVVIDELKKQGIPAYAELKTGYFDAIEIKIMLNQLKIIDNPYQDIPLASVLRSPIVGLSEEELALIRLANQRGNYYEALEDFLKQFNHKETSRVKQDLYTKILNFKTQLKAFRQLAKETTLSEVIWTVFLETGYYDFVGGIPGGRQRQANLRALYDRARGYERSSYHGLYRFLRFIERMEEERKDLGSARALSEEEDVVRLMTIHKSKGLEFPFVILGSLEHQFNQQDVRKKYIVNKELNFASKYIDAEKNVMYPTLYFEAAKRVEVKKMLAEEMRVLYVALTRAKEKLVMVGSVTDFEKTIAKWQEVHTHREWVLPLSVRKQSKSYLDWIGPALIRHHEINKLLQNDKQMTRPIEGIYDDSSSWQIEIVEKESLQTEHIQTDTSHSQLEESVVNWKDNGVFGPSIDTKVSNVLSFEYPYKKAMETRAKESVTEIKHRHERYEAHSSQNFLPSFSKLSEIRPNFLGTKKALSKSEIGTATHTVMQHLPFDKPLNAHEIKQFIEDFIDQEILTVEEGQAIDIDAIEVFLNSDFAKKYFFKFQLDREVPFTYMLPAEQAYPEWKNEHHEKLLIQGIIDCLIHTPEGPIILDYKTDTISDEVNDALILKLEEKYRIQMKLYKLALENIYKQPLKAVYLYYFSKGILIKMRNV